MRTCLKVNKNGRYRCVDFRMFLIRLSEVSHLLPGPKLSWIINFRSTFQNKSLQRFSIFFFLFKMRACPPPKHSKLCHVAFKQKRFHSYQWQKIEKNLYCCQFFSFVELRANIQKTCKNLFSCAGPREKKTVNILRIQHSANNDILSILLSTILFLLFWFALIF